MVRVRRVNELNKEDKSSPVIDITSIWIVMRTNGSTIKFKMINHPIYWIFMSMYFHLMIIISYCGSLVGGFSYKDGVMCLLYWISYILLMVQIMMYQIIVLHNLRLLIISNNYVDKQPKRYRKVSRDL